MLEQPAKLGYMLSKKGKEDTSLTFTVFNKEDFSEYLSWFQDAELNKQLGPMEPNDEWLTYTLNQQVGLQDSEGYTYSVFRHEELVAVIAFDYPTEAVRAYYISSLAVKPKKKGIGIGTQDLQKIMELHPPTHAIDWIAFIQRNNPKAKLFFEKNGWECISDATNKTDMWSFAFRKPLRY